MKIEIAKTANGYRVDIKEVIKSIEDSGNFKKELSTIINSDAGADIEVHILDSYIITSSIIGSLMKFTQRDGAKISIHIYNSDLYDLLDKLNLIQLLNVKKHF